MENKFKLDMKKLIIIQTVTPDYRRNLFFYIKDKLGQSFELYGGERFFEKSLKSDPSIIFTKPLKNYFLFRRKFLFHTGMWHLITKNNIMILEINPRILSNWLILLIRKVFYRKTILWGHAWPRAGANSKTDRVRNMMRKLGDELIVYTKTQQQELQHKMPNKKINVASNAVFFNEEMIVCENTDLIKNVIYVGRLTKNKKAFFLVKAFHQILKKLPSDANLLIIGDAEERKTIKKYIRQNGLEDRIKVLGHIADYEKLKKLYATSLVSISPGYIGLSVTQSFGFGVPMIVSRNERHSPEIEAVIEGENAEFFVTDDMDSLSQKILNFYDERRLWIDKRIEICNSCKKNYSIEAMAKPFLSFQKELNAENSN